MASAHLIDSLQGQISSCEAQLQDLRRQLAEAQYSQQEEQRGRPNADPLAFDFSHGIHDDFRSEIEAVLSHTARAPLPSERWPLNRNEYRRYGRQLIMPEVGLQGHLRLKNASVLIIGVGGLGCPAAAYLAGAGVGTIGLVDGDVVEESNLHRQILHSTARVGMSKVDSAMVALHSLNPSVNLVPYKDRLTPETAISTIQDYDLVLDCTDTPASRYLVSDACVLTGKPLVSAAALRIDGQLMVLNNPPLPAGDTAGGPCYRCVYPKPPPPESIETCGEGGILGPVVGVMGVLQALEAIKVLTRSAPVSGDGVVTAEPPSLLIFCAYTNPMFRSIRLRSRKAKCAACSAQATITPEALTSGSLDYVQFCGSIAPVHALNSDERISAENYAKVRFDVNPFTGFEPKNDSHILIDVREKVQYDLCNIEGSVNIPYSAVTRIPARSGNTKSAEDPEWIAELKKLPEKPVFVVCRKGNDSQITVRKMKELGLDNGGQRWIGDIKGGLVAWRQNVDKEFPDY
ncbi:hypothetical protein P280DRAFT_471416 [Massarina eburnea CBS 473.64]|uniref:Adenylyltransferase and sulfurtransferase uba4 n=1 Tax=Massarina eburnea CBS 473.64 TaxID=1395130 RepID=A0A6A6RSY2_9PLEO|nr:hypothetical protein P280DRAFT_471416 [Massarina eburnea CBS 473.64]